MQPQIKIQCPVTIYQQIQANTFYMTSCKLEVVQKTRFLGLIIRSDFKWIFNTEHMIKKANKRLWIIPRLRNLGGNKENLVEVYTKQV